MCPIPPRARLFPQNKRGRTAQGLVTAATISETVCLNVIDQLTSLLQVALRALGFPVKKPEVKTILANFDKDESGKIDFNEFLAILKEKMLNRDPEEQLKKAFQLFDFEGAGKISIQNLRTIAKEIGDTVEEDDLYGMIQEFDKDGDGKINEEEFLEIMKLQFE